MPEVVILGQPYWSRRIASTLADPDRGISARHVPASGYGSLLARLPRGKVVLIRAGYRVGGTTLRARLFDAYWAALRARLPDAVTIHYWLGTDVLNTLEEAAAGTLRQGPVGRARADRHIADAPWLADELAELGFRADVVPVPQAFTSPPAVSPLPARFSILTYLPGARFDFFGGPTTLAAARALPEVPFTVVGRSGPWIADAPPNVRSMGWVEAMGAQYEAACAVLRIPQHDGLGGTVVEGLLHGRYAIYGYGLPHCVEVRRDSVDSVVEAIAGLAAEHRAGRLPVNEAGRSYAVANFAPSVLSERLRAIILGER